MRNTHLNDSVVGIKWTKRVWGRHRGTIRDIQMLRIPCPYCGVRDFTEFVYGGDASNQIPDLADSNIDHWTEYAMFRDNPKASHAEYWHHRSGCGQWLRVVRDTVTHAIDSVARAREHSWQDSTRDQEQK